MDVRFWKRPVQSRWADFEWEPDRASLSEAVVAADSPEAHQVDGVDRWTWRGCEMDLHPSEGEGYWLNLTSEAPCVFVMWRMEEGEALPRPVVVTASYNEAGRMLDASDRVDRVPMEEALQAALAEYTMKYYVPEKRRKVKRNDPFNADKPQRGEMNGERSNELIVPADSPAARRGAR